MASTMDSSSKLADLGIRLRSTSEGEHRTLCPICTPQRKRPEADLAVKIDSLGFQVYCHHCAWKASYAHDGIEPRDNFSTAVIVPLRPGVSQILDPLAEDYLKTRGISAETLGHAGAYSHVVSFPDGPKKCIAFPYRRESGGPVVGVKYRSKDKRFLQEKGSEQIFWGLDRITAPAETLVITEGEIDALSFLEIGTPNVLSVPGGAPQTVSAGNRVDPADDKKFAFVWDAAGLLNAARRVVLAVDGDGPGQALEEELSRRLGKDKCWRVTWPAGTKDANEVLTQHGAEALRAVLDAAIPYPIKALVEPESFRSEILGLYRDGRTRGLKVGYPGLDDLWTFRPGELTVLTGVPNQGKSELCDQIMVNLSESYGLSWAVCSWENPPADHLTKLIEKHLRKPFLEGNRERLTEGEIDSGLAWVGEHFHLIQGSDEPQTIEWVLETARAAVMRFGIRGLVIDPYAYLEKDLGQGSETEFVASMLRKVKKFSVAHAVHVLFICHPQKLYRDKSGKTPVPGAYDLMGSSHWANLADNILAIARDYETGEVDLYVRKVRFKATGTTGACRLGYDKITGVYYQGSLSEPLSVTEAATIEPTPIRDMPF